MKKKIMEKWKIEWLIENYPSKGSKECSVFLGEPPNRIRKIASELKIKVNKETRIKIQKENGNKFKGKYKLDDTQINWLKTNYPLLGSKKCGEYLNISQKYISTLASKMKIRVNKKIRIKNMSGKIPHNKKYYLNEEQKQWLKINYFLLGEQICGKHLNIPSNAIGNIARKMNLYVSNETKSKFLSIRSKKQHLNKRNITIQKSNLINISNPDQAYSLGFLWGDGYLSHYKNNYCFYPTVQIQRKDYDEIINTLCSIGKWKTYYRQRGNKKEQGNGVLCDNVWGYFLKDNDYILKSKVSPSKILSHIPNELKPYWWRGYVDADGCFYTNNKCYQFSLAGSYEQEWIEFEKLLISLGAKYSVKRRIQNKKSKSSTVLLTSREAVILLGNYIYGNNTDIGLKRKQIKFSSIKNSIGKNRKNAKSYSVSEKS